MTDPSFQEANRLAKTRNSLSKAEIKDYSIMIHGLNVFNESVENNLIAFSNLITHDSIQKIATAQRDDYTTG